MRLALVAAGMLLFGVYAHAAPPPTEPWRDTVRCIALGERTPEIDALSRKMMRELVSDSDPEIANLAKASLQMLDAMDGLKPLIEEATRLQRQQALQQIGATISGNGKQNAEAVFAAELEAARREYADIKLSADDPQLKTQISRLEAEHDRRCGAKPD